LVLRINDEKRKNEREDRTMKKKKKKHERQVRGKEMIRSWNRDEFVLNVCFHDFVSENV